MESQWLLSPARQLTEEEKALVWKKPATHLESDAERRICHEVKRNWTRSEMKITTILLEGDAGSGKTQLAKALSADFGLPYTKVTCFADMDKSDVVGSILPVLPEDGSKAEDVEYRYYPSEIVRAYENGWLLEIQEPTVIRDAAVLMAVSSALEPEGSLNLPTRIVRRHPDFIAVITTNRGYNGCRPLNEALRDRVQHSEKMDLPAVEVMVQRASAKTGCTEEGLLLALARVIVLLDQTAKANAIKGVAGMRSYFFWVDAVLQGIGTVEALYHKVIYKITTDPDEIAILEQALKKNGMLAQLEEIAQRQVKTNGQVMEIRADGTAAATLSEAVPEDIPAVALRRSKDSKDSLADTEESAAETKNSTKTENAAETGSTSQTESTDRGGDGDAVYHELKLTGNEELEWQIKERQKSEQQQLEQKQLEQQRQDFRKHLNRQAREMVKGSSHEKVNLIVHRPEATLAHHREYHEIASALLPVIQELVRKTTPLLEHELSGGFAKSRLYGTKFHAEKLASPDFRYYSQKCPPNEEPSLAVALRIDESASMSAFGRLDAAKQAAVAVYEFCESCNIPLLIYGDTADRSPLERMSLFSYIDYENPLLNDKYCLMAIRGHSNNRDGMALRILAEKLVKAPQRTKLLISISDGQPKAVPDYTGQAAIEDMKGVIKEFGRKGILFLAAAIGQDKDTLCDIYGQERFLDITDLRQLPARLVQVIARYL